MSDPVIIELPWPDKRLSPNARVHWLEKWRVGSSMKKHAEWAAIAAGAKRLKNSSTIRATIIFTPPDARRRDDDNAISSMKYARDAIASATGVDDSRWVTSYEFTKPEKPGRVTVKLEAAE